MATAKKGVRHRAKGKSSHKTIRPADPAVLILKAWKHWACRWNDATSRG